ncbi:MAG: FAD-dependent oxidoreductase [Inquilinaceae bacterium]
MAVRPAANVTFEATVPVLIVGAGACGLIAALAAREQGAEVAVLERDPVPSGSTALSAGLIPAAGTRFQRARGIEDTAQAFAADIQAKTKGRADAAMVAQIAAQSGPTVDWLADRAGIPFEIIEDFRYPGHSAPRMHGLPDRTGAALLARLRAAAEAAGIDILTDATVTTLFAEPNGRVVGVEMARPDGTVERIGCGALILACNGYGGDPDMVRTNMPEMANAIYFGHTGNRGDAVRWGRALGAATRHMGSYQGHGSVAHPHGILISWATITEGGIQVNAAGQRFADESRGYSEQAVDVLAQPGGVAWTVYDARIEAIARQFEDYRQAEAAGAIRRAKIVAELETAIGLPAGSLSATLEEVAAVAGSGRPDRFGRRFDRDRLLVPPYAAVRVTGTLFHTQGGLVVDGRARVLRPDGRPLPNLYAGGGAACGVSGPSADGYLSGNGLLTAVVLGRLAGQEAARSQGGTTP